MIYRAVLVCVALRLCALAGTDIKGIETCASCHTKEVKSYSVASMGRAMELGHSSAILTSHPKMTFSYRGYRYTIERVNGASTYSVSNGSDSLTLPIEWAFGLGSAGQTYVLQKDGIYYESMVSYYRAIDGLDVTIGDQPLHPVTLTEAIGRPLGERERVACFGCHSTGSVQDNKLHTDTLRPGVQCDHCHVDAASHVDGLKTGHLDHAQMQKLSAMTAEEVNTFCGQCHRTWEQIITNGPRGILNVRFQPYRLTYSRCYDAEDRRISCVACHNPHQEVDRVTKNYDSKCMACHAGGKPDALSCKVAKENCASCHMQKVEIPGSHHRFADHYIRVIKANSPYPE